MLLLEERLPNRKAKVVFDRILRHGVVSKQELIDYSGMTVSTLTRVLEELVGTGLIAEAGFGESTGGRKPILYRPEPGYGVVFGVEISRIFSHLFLFDLQLNKLEMKRWVMSSDMTPNVLLRQVADAAREMLARRRVPQERLLGFGIGAVGPLDRRSGVILEPLYFPAEGWKNVPIRDWFEREFDVPVLLENGANAAVFGEYWSERQSSFEHLLYVHAGVGLRSAMISNGQIVYGAVDMEGSVGQMVIQTDGLKPREAWGNYGALESYATTYALEQRAAALLKQRRNSLLRERVRDPEAVSFADLVAALEAQDPMVQELFTQSAALFGIGLANLLNILHPEKVILGGPLISSHPLYFQAATEVAVKNTCYYPTYNVLFSRGNLGDEALGTGAAAMVLSRLTAGGV